MKILGIVLGALIILIQYPLWVGKGGWLRAWEMDRQVQGQRDKNAELQRRNARLEAEVNDLKQGTEAIEERARYELGMIRGDEVFYQLVPQENRGQSPISSAPQSATSGSKKSH